MAKIGLYNLEPHIVNSAMMQVSQYYKNRGDTVEKYSPLFHSSYDKIYAFSLFDFTDKGYVSSDMICGGTGFDITSRLPKEIEDSDYDWSLYPDCDFSMVWFSRGCIRNCPFCVVQQKEGPIHPVEPKNLNPNGEYIKVMDNNFFANPNWRSAVEQLQEWNQKVDMQGFDIRIFNEEQGEALKSLKFHHTFKFAWDNPHDNIDDKIEQLIDIVPHRRTMCYVLIGYWSTPEEDLMRVRHLWDDFGVDPYVMPFNPFDKYQKAFARYVNNKIVFKTRSWEEYLDGYTDSQEAYQKILARKESDRATRQEKLW